MKNVVVAFSAGILFGLGLILSEMVNPLRVRGFLDITGHWDPTLVFVMLGALGVTAIGYRLVLQNRKPLFENSFSLPTNTVIDKSLVFGAVLFGIGWGLSGLCPGPAVVGLASLHTDIIIFIVAMLLGMKGFEYLKRP